MSLKPNCLCVVMLMSAEQKWKKKHKDKEASEKDRARRRIAARQAEVAARRVPSPPPPSGAALACLSSSVQPNVRIVCRVSPPAETPPPFGGRRWPRPHSQAANKNPLGTEEARLAYRKEQGPPPPHPPCPILTRPRSLCASKRAPPPLPVLPLRLPSPHFSLLRQGC